MNHFEKWNTRDEKIDKFLDAAGWWYSEKNPSPNMAILGLTEEIKKAWESSDRLTKALNKITSWGVWAAWSAVAVAFLSLILETIKFFRQ